MDDHEHSPRLCATCIERRYLELRPAPRARVNATLVAARIRRDTLRGRPGSMPGSAWGAAVEFGISYGHALAIRRGWRGAGRRADPLPYRSRGWSNGRRNGWSDRALRVLPGGRLREREATA